MASFLDSPGGSKVGTAPQNRFAVPVRPANSTASDLAKPSPILIALALFALPASIAYALATNNENQVVAFVLAALGGLLIIARPFWGLIFFVGLLYTRPEENIPSLAGTHLALMVSQVSLGALILHKLLSRESFVKTPLNPLILGFGGAVVLSTAVAGGDVAATAQDIGRLVILALLIVNLATTEKRYALLVTALIVFSGYLAGFSIYLFGTGQMIMQDGIMRSQATGIFGDPNDLACTIAAGIGLALPRLRQGGKISRVFFLVLLILMAWAVTLTNSRGGMLSLLVIVAGYIFVSARNKVTATVAAVSAGMLLLVVLGGGRMTNFDSTEASANTRFWFWSNGVEQLMSHPITGIGYGGFMGVNGGMTAHNSFVLCFAEMGLVGYFFWMGCLYYAFFKNKALTAARALGDAYLSRDAYGGQVALAGYLVGSFFLSHTYTPVLYILICLPSVQRLVWVREENGEADVFRWRTAWVHIAALSVASIIFIYIYALKNR